MKDTEFIKLNLKKGSSVRSRKRAKANRALPSQREVEVREVIQEAVRNPAKVDTAIDFLKKTKQEIANEREWLDGDISVSKLVLGLGDADDITLQRRQFILEWLMNSGSHPDYGTISKSKIAEMFGVDQPVVDLDVKRIRKQVNDAFSTPDQLRELVLTVSGSAILSHMHDRKRVINHVASVERMIQTLETYFDTHGLLADNKTKPPKISLEGKSGVVAIGYGEARKLYLRLIKLRAEALDRAMKSTSAMVGVMQQVMRSSGGPEGVTFVMNDNRQVNVGQPATLQDLLNAETNLKLPVGLSQDEMDIELGTVEEGD
jgi:hypothetical protein